MTQRRSFADILKNSGIDIKVEYRRLESVMFDCLVEDRYLKEECLYDRIDKSFLDMDIRGTCLTLDGFNDQHGFTFGTGENEPPITTDRLVSFCEYVYNLCKSYVKQYIDENDPFDDPSMNYGERYDCAIRAMQQVDAVIESLGYEPYKEDGLTIFVEASEFANKVAASLPDPLAYNVIKYAHHSMKGDLERKRSILQQLANELEPKRGVLEGLDGQTSGNIFYAFNNFGIRHSNLDPDSKHYRDCIAALSTHELEALYDDVYNLCLIALYQFDSLESYKRINDIREANK